HHRRAVAVQAGRAMTLRRLLDILLALIPRWATEDWAVRLVGEFEVEPVKCMQYVEPGEVYDGIAELTYFTWLELAFGGGEVATLRPWVNPHDTRTEV